MSARSPRGSLSGASSAEVADDFGESLKDLQMNNRYEISNLTVIAKENTEHAQAISQTLENHIKTASPNRKLPALYVLDSIVKNVGTPYTVYLARNLYSTFMEAYTLVDSNTRRNMDSMLKTWKEAVPGSMDPRPVFPPETVRPIENALLKAKTAALQHRPQGGYRNTPTPPQTNGQFGPPPSQTQATPYYGANSQHPTPQQHYGQPALPPTPSQQQTYPYGTPSQQLSNDVGTIKRDLAVLIAGRRTQFGANPLNPDRTVATQLEGLLALQTIMDTQQLDQASLQQVRNQLNALSVGNGTQSRPTPPVASASQWQPPALRPPVASTPQWQPPASTPQPPFLAQPPQNTYVPPPSVQPHAAPPTLPPGALSGLQALLNNTQKPGTPQMRVAAPALQNASHTQLNSVQNQAASAPSFDRAALFAALTKNGLIPPSTQAAPATPVPAPAIAPKTQTTADLLKSLSSVLPPKSRTGTPTLVPAQLANIGKPRIPMTAAALKTFRPELVHSLYDAQPNQCSSCGRRFLATEEGRAKKNRHLDWHFRTNQRMADPSTNRGQHRNWYPRELDWIVLADFDPSTTTAGEGGDSADAAAQASRKKTQKQRPEHAFIRAAPGQTRATCTICAEEMRSEYSEELQDWVFMNARMYQGNIVHATCLAELQKGAQGGGALAAALGGLVGAGVGQRERSATPDSVARKRKADAALGGAGVRVRME